LSLRAKRRLHRIIRQTPRKNHVNIRVEKCAERRVKTGQPIRRREKKFPARESSESKSRDFRRSALCGKRAT